MPASNKQTTLWVADTLSWLLHFTRKFNLAITSRFPGSGIMACLSFSYLVQWTVRFAPPLQWPDRSGFTPDSLFCWHLIINDCQIPSALAMFNMELYWHYNNTLLIICQYYFHHIYIFLIIFFRYICKRKKTAWQTAARLLYFYFLLSVRLIQDVLQKR